MSNIIGIFIVSVSSSLFLLLILRPEGISISEFIFTAIAAAFSMVAIIGYVLLLLKMPVTAKNFMLYFYTALIVELFFIAAAFLNGKKYLLPVKISSDKRSFIMPALIFIAAFILLIYPSLPDLIQVKSREELQDGGTHLWHSLRVFSVMNIQNSLWHLHGYHFNVAFFSNLLNAPILNFIYPFMVFLNGLCAVAMFYILAHNKGEAFSGLTGAMLLVFSTYFMDQLTTNGFYAQIFGSFLFIVFIYLMLKFIDNPDIKGLAFFILIFSGVIVSNALWAPAMLTSFIILSFIVIKRAYKRSKMLVFIIGLMDIAILYLAYCLVFFNYRYSSYSIIGELMKNMSIQLKNDGGVVHTEFIKFYPEFTIRSAPVVIFAESFFVRASFLLFLAGIAGSIAKKENKAILIILLSIAMQAVFLGWGVKHLSFGAYWYHKMFYLLYIPYVILLIYGGRYIAGYLYLFLTQSVKLNLARAKIIRGSLYGFIFLPLLFFSVSTGAAYLKVSDKAMSRSDRRLAENIRNYLYRIAPSCTIAFVSRAEWADWVLKSYISNEYGWYAKIIPETSEGIVKWIDSKGEDLLFVPNRCSYLITPHIPRLDIIYKEGDSYLVSRK